MTKRLLLAGFVEKVVEGYQQLFYRKNRKTNWKYRKYAVLLKLPYLKEIQIARISFAPVCTTLNQYTS
jgi:hypothetical protein